MHLVTEFNTLLHCYSLLIYGVHYLPAVANLCDP